MQFIDLLNESDLKRVKGLGFDVNARVCSLRSSGHYPILAGWDSLETLYLGFEGVKLGSHCLIGFRELGRKDYIALLCGDIGRIIAGEICGTGRRMLRLFGS
jgi:hypothetical protein